MKIRVHLTGTRIDELVDPESVHVQFRLDYNYIHRPEDCKGLCAKIRRDLGPGVLIDDLPESSRGVCPLCLNNPHDEDCPDKDFIVLGDVA